jgi:hypothetical protein
MMMLAFHFVAAFSLALLLFGSAKAQQVPTAPPPHPALDEVVKEYKRFGLPLPPPKAQLVRIERRHVRPHWTGAQLIGIDPRSQRSFNRFEQPKEPNLLAYRIPPLETNGRSRYLTAGLFGVGLLESEVAETAAVEELEPTHEALLRVGVESGGQLIALAVQCKDRGWGDLATAVYVRAREKLVEGKKQTTL